LQEAPTLIERWLEKIRYFVSRLLRCLADLSGGIGAHSEWADAGRCSTSCPRRPGHLSTHGASGRLRPGDSSDIDGRIKRGFCPYRV